jgi:hypothetical protein
LGGAARGSPQLTRSVVSALQRKEVGDVQQSLRESARAGRRVSGARQRPTTAPRRRDRNRNGTQRRPAPPLLGTAYLTLHLIVTVAVLLWLHQRRPAAFAFVRTTLLLASGLALIGFLVYPTAPPRLAGIGIADTVSNGHISLNHGLVSSLYNPYAAVPSMHIGYALVVAASLLRYGRQPLVRALGVLYAPVVLLVVVATGNHFFVDAAAGALVAGLAAAATAVLTRRATPTQVTALPMRREPLPAIERRAA